MIPSEFKFANAIRFGVAVALVCACLNSRAGDYNLTNKPLLLRVAWPLQQQDTTQNDKVFTAVEINPEFPGGDKAFGQYLGNNIRYPKEAKEKNIQGRVFVQFVVEKDGSLSEMKTVRDPGAGLGDEAIRVLSASPHWKPGVQNGKPVRVQYTVPINFCINDDSPKGNLALAPFDSFMAKHIRYPRFSIENNITGVAIASFTINDDQSIKEANILKSLAKDIDNEVIMQIKAFKSNEKIPAGNYLLACRFCINEVTKEPVIPDSITHMDNYAGEIIILGYSR